MPGRASRRPRRVHVSIRVLLVFSIAHDAAHNLLLRLSPHIGICQPGGKNTPRRCCEPMPRQPCFASGGNVWIRCVKGGLKRNCLSKKQASDPGRLSTGHDDPAPSNRTVAVAGVLAVNPNSTRPGGVERTSTRVDVIEMMKDAKDLPEQSYQAF
jgi:hypothetical protein